MSDIKISEMFEMQLELFEKYKNKWSPLQPQNGRNSILWMIGELGEAQQEYMPGFRP